MRREDVDDAIESHWVCYVCSEHYDDQQSLREHWEESGCYTICHNCSVGYEDGGGECVSCDAYLCPDCLNGIKSCPVCGG